MSDSSTTRSKFSKADYASDQDVRWCPGCGDYAILASVQRTLPELGVSPSQTVFVSGIGCAARFPYYMNTYGFHTIHGRAPAVATGLKLANPEVSVWVVTGDGDALSIGGNHLLHTLRRNVDLNILLFNNRIYGLTKGQYSPTSLLGQVTPSTPLGSVDMPVSPLRLALGAGGRFVARGYDVSKRLPELLKEAHAHVGASFVEILQNCPVFNDGAWSDVTDRKRAAESQLWLESGQPMRFGPNREKGIRLRNAQLEVVTIGRDAEESEVLVHDEQNIGVAFLLAGLGDPVAFGVLYRDPAPAYDAAVRAQNSSAVARAGIGDLHALLHSGHTWTVE
ncbi:MAG: 2-oxoacid:ferredoxin oxidoreductase subunit beta [Myxococcota bacterium]